MSSSRKKRSDTVPYYPPLYNCPKLKKKKKKGKEKKEKCPVNCSFSSAHLKNVILKIRKFVTLFLTLTKE